VLRTDVMMHCAMAEPDTSSPAYLLAAEWFHEAQQQELLGNVQATAELYERALSQRRLGSASSSAPDASWDHILFFLGKSDLTQLRVCSRNMCALVQRNAAVRKVRWNKQFPQLPHIADAQAADSRLPVCLFGYGARAMFNYTRTTFDAAPDACLRATMMGGSPPPPLPLPHRTTTTTSRITIRGVSKR